MPSVTQNQFGHHDNEPVLQYVLQNELGMKVSLLSYGAIIQRIQYPDRDGQLKEMVLGFDDLASYIEDAHYIGALVGRYANRIANASFSIKGVATSLDANSGNHHLHGGSEGLHNRVWKSSVQQDNQKVSVVMSTLLPDGTSGYPGDLFVTAVYSLSNDNALSLDLRATSNAITPVNLTSHPYFCLGFDDTILDAELQVNAHAFTKVDADLIPTGEIEDVAGTPFDFRRFTPIGQRIKAQDETIKHAAGYDVNFVVNDACHDLSKPMARLKNTAMGLQMEVFSTKPGLQVYSGNFIHESQLNGASPHAAVCLEPQFYPDSPNKAHFPISLLHPEQTYRHAIAWAFRSI